MTELTFKFDCQLDDEENWIAEGTKVLVADDYAWRYKDSTPVIITEAYTYEGEPIKFSIPQVVYYMNCSFKELS